MKDDTKASVGKAAGLSTNGSTTAENPPAVAQMTADVDVEMA